MKADNYSKSNIPVLKLNATKKFNTGIYPYSIMQSSFYPVGQQSHALKLSASIQEWCGQVYAQLNNRDAFELESRSYFQSEGDQNYSLEKTYLENEIWNLIRINPEALPVGEFEMIPSLEYSQLRHQPIKAYKATATLNSGTYTISYPELERKLMIRFHPEFPYDIELWEESLVVGYGNTQHIMKTQAKKMKQMKTAYWSKNSNSDLILRQELNLE